MTDTPTTPPGWYHAEGDPPGTQRYWDGTHWQGGPQPVLGHPGGSPFANATTPATATPGSRFVAFLIDSAVLLAGYLIVAALTVGGTAISDALGGLFLLVGGLAVVAAAIYNYWYLQGTTGQTIGKRRQAIKLVSAQTQEPIGVGMTIVRYIVLSIFAIPCYLDHWWILVDENNQRLSDKTLGNVVVKA